VLVQHCCCSSAVCRTTWWIRNYLHECVVAVGRPLCAGAGQETNLVLLLVMLRRSFAGTPLLPGSDPAVRQCQVGCGAHTCQHALLERSTVSILQTKASCARVAFLNKEQLIVLCLPGLAWQALVHLATLKVGGGARACLRWRSASLLPGAAGCACTCSQGSWYVL